MPISGTLYPWDKINVLLVKDEAATFALFHNNKLIYIGSTSNLQEEFLHFWKTKFKDNPQLKVTNNYKREYRDDYKKREKELLKEFLAKYGKLPKCNDGKSFKKKK